MFEHMESLGVLNVVTCVWGTQHPVIKEVVEALSDPTDASSAAGAAVLLNLVRFGLAALAFAPFLPDPPWPPKPTGREPMQASLSDANCWRFGPELGFWMFLGFALQSTGLAFTSASRSAFLLYLK